jgi:hypothetical protein
MILASTSLNRISMSDFGFGQLTAGSHNIIKERSEVIRVTLSLHRVDSSKLADCITGGKVLKKVILDGSNRPAVSGQANTRAELKKVVKACKKMKTVELWKVNFIVNGKVDLNAVVVSPLISFDPWTSTS